ncbi:MAG: hypothetical protein DMF06_03345 [Verrucomicrobia bacterium]|nr:MAG: hypothetical protein DMF06_03345 [Verrucomicrobiota bacterium]
MQKTRLANKTQWALYDIAARCLAASKRWEKAMAMAERNQDPAMMTLLARMRDDIAVIERKAKDALNGDYQEEMEL